MTIGGHVDAICDALRNLPLETRKQLKTEAQALGWMTTFAGSFTYRFFELMETTYVDGRTVSESVDHILDLAGLNASAV